MRPKGQIKYLALLLIRQATPSYDPSLSVCFADISPILWESLPLPLGQGKQEKKTADAVFFRFVGHGLGPVVFSE